MIFFARATRGLRRPSHGLMARLGVPLGGRVRKSRAVNDNLATPLSIAEEGKVWIWAEGLKCSCNARPRKTRVGHAQWETI